MNRTTRVLAMVACCLIAFLAAFDVAQALIQPPDAVPDQAGTRLAAAAEWRVQVRDASLMKLAPPQGFITDAKTLAEVWSAWRVSDDPPMIDFAKQIVLLATTSGPNEIMFQATIDDEGAVRFDATSTLMAGPGFAAMLQAVDRKWIKSVNGVPIAGVHGQLTVPANLASFTDQMLEVRLYEYDPRLADVRAKEVATFKKADFSHTTGSDTVLAFSLGHDLVPRADRAYYLTVFVTNDGQRTHIGEAGGQSGPIRVLTNGNANFARVVLRAVR